MGTNTPQISNERIAHFRADLDHLRQTILSGVRGDPNTPIQVQQQPFRYRADLHKTIMAKLTEFRGEIERVDRMLATQNSHPIVPRMSPLDIDHGKLRDISKHFAKTMQEIMNRARSLRNKMRREWPGDPRLCAESVLQPFGIQDKEVRLTRALAWLMTPRDPLCIDFLAAFVTMAMPSKNLDVSNWDVSAEEPSEAEDGVRGRIDIQLHGKVDSEEWVIAIEAKISAGENENQLANYDFSLGAQFPNAKRRIVFLTKDGRNSETLPNALPKSYAHLLEAWLPVLRDHDKKHNESACGLFARLLLADIARDLAETHLGELGKDGLPRGLDLKLGM